MNRVAAVAFGGTRFSRGPAGVEGELLGAARDLLARVPGLRRGDVGAVLVSTNDGSGHLAAILSELAGMRPSAAHTVESLCGSGTSAVVSAAAHVAAGLADVALVAGADRFDGPGQVLGWDRTRGRFARPVYWASLFAGAYKRAYGAADEDLAAVPVKNRRNALLNPAAHAGAEITVADVLSSREITADLRLYDCSVPCTGAAAVLLASERAAAGLTDAPVWITGIGQRTESAGLSGCADLARMGATAEAARAALSMAGRRPADVDVVELHDAFSVCEPMALEALGLAGRGRGARMAADLLATGDRRVNPRGGLLGAGHPPGATGVAQAAEVVAQLQGAAGGRQVQGARTGMVHNMSAAATSATVLVMEA